jgi:RNA polymerase sigma-70 factor (ECF subfamily)
MTVSAQDDGLSAFVGARRRMFGIAYRMLGSAVEAEDILQEVWMRWQAADRGGVENAAAYLATMTTRLAINVSQSARSRHETYIGPWLPEPVDTSADPTLGAERGEALEFAVLILLEKLSPKERAAYILREAFNYPYPEIANMLRLSEANTRQLVSRARKHIADGRRTPVSSVEQRRLLEAFIVAAQNGDIATLEGLFASDIASYSDGGGFMRAAQKPLVGRGRVVKLMTAIASSFWVGVTIETIETNGQASVLIRRGGAVIALATIDASAQGIEQILWMMRPSKLAAVCQPFPQP